MDFSFNKIQTMDLATGLHLEGKMAANSNLSPCPRQLQLTPKKLSIHSQNSLGFHQGLAHSRERLVDCCSLRDLVLVE